MEEEWKPIEGYEGQYSVSNLGRVCGHNAHGHGRTALLKQQTVRGYLMVQLWWNGKPKMHRVNRLVASAFIPNPLGLPLVNHIREPKTNNRWDNLEWSTTYDNQLHAMKTGLYKSKLDADTVQEIRRHIDLREEPQYLIAKRFGVAYSTICAISSGRYWSWLPREGR